MTGATAAYLLRRVLLLVPLALGLSILMFGLIHAAPGDPVLALLGPQAAANPRFLEQARANYGLDDPLPIQYLHWLGNVVQGDFGRSYAFNNVPVLELIGQRATATLQLQGVALAIALLIAVPVGILSATRQYSTTDNLVTIGSFVGLALPNFWLALLLQIWLAVELGWLPTLSAGQAKVPWPGRLEYFVMPVAVAALPSVAYYARFMRSAMLEVVGQDYVRTARAKGIGPRGVLYGHALRNALIPMVTVIGLQLPQILGGTVIIEQIFAWPGLGDLAFQAITRRDYPVILAVTMISGIAVMVASVLTDLAYVLVDPRVKLTGHQ
ncbi:MAG: Dipeptide transport system permease protein DppB [uncultured Thermomicrobiales bacterium]|uniref:Dipeptide transport system permease protein DppB n=1 Tax=uncultured Thermomicrobiales bacterium TaxID=1645740 RepID=A0A6J4TC39_9BACT|nr:MAG: Dipeptide transport system permease protein DppB [uncultured Thermomicrobiales bacterium]